MFVQINASFEKQNFPIIISNNSLFNLSLYLNNFNEKQVLIVADKIFKSKFHPDKLLQKIFTKYDTFFCNAGIKRKNFKSIFSILTFLNKNNCDKESIIIAIGGGVIGDLCGFVASIYKRGIRVVHVPTTMTSAVDSCIGGKTGINEFNQVNLIGTYHHPDAIFIDTRFLKTLNKRDFKSGIVESIKKALISNKNFFSFLNNNSLKILEKEEELIIELIKKSLEYKIFYASNDVKEKSLRMLLNYGHTFGQSIESYYGINENNITHGEAVSLGMICAAHLAIYLNKGSLIKEHLEILKKYNLPTHIKNIKGLKKPNYSILTKFVDNDKKKKINNNRFIICSKIGSAEIINIKNKAIINNCFKKIIN
jgi:3-dehydroquinate synthetase